MFGGDWAFDLGASGRISGWVPRTSKLELVSTGPLTISQTLSQQHFAQLVETRSWLAKRLRVR